MASHTVSVSGFEGPLDLLLELIEQEKMDVTQVSLAHVTNQYLQRIRAMETIPPEDLAQFLVIAARLILLKSRRLIPQLVLTPDEEESILSLEQQLREYQKFRVKGKMLREQWQSAPRLHAREGFLGMTVMFYPPPGITPSTLHDSVTALVRILPTVEREREQAIRKIVSLEERIRELQSRVQEAAVTSFRDVVTKGKRRADVIVSFLALLELVKQRMLSVEQSNAFHDILIRKRSSS